MTITLTLNSEEENILRRTAEAAGADIDAVLHRLIALLVSPEALPEDAVSKEAGAAVGAEEELAEELEEEQERRREQEEMQANIRRWHAERGEAAP